MQRVHAVQGTGPQATAWFAPCNCLSSASLCHSSSVSCLTRSRRHISVMASGDQGNRSRTNPEKEVGVGLKAVWYGAEVLGKVVGRGQEQANSEAIQTQQLSREECIAAIKADYETSYFVSGKGDMLAYAPDCEFSDPFVAFKGTKRFQQNVGNLGGLMRDINLDVYEFNEQGNSEVETKWRFSCILDLPWRPRLAAAGGTTHVIQDGLVIKHIERWDVEPGKVVKQLFQPAAKVPSNAWEAFFMSASSGDAAGVWLVLTPSIIKLSLPIIAVSLVTKLATGEGLPGVFLGTLEGLSYLGFVAAGATQVVKLAKGM